MSRSIQVAPKWIPEMKLALKRKGFPSQSAFARELGLARATVTKFFTGKPISYLNFVEISEKLGFDWQEIVLLKDGREQDWGEAPDVDFFSGRSQELATLDQWIVTDKCRLVALSGMAGIGKTALAVKLARQVQKNFDRLIYRSLRFTPSLSELLADLLQFLSNQLEKKPESAAIGLGRLIESLGHNRCLLLLDDAQAILSPGKLVGEYREGYEDYQMFLRRMGQAPHQSCLLLLGREKPRDIEYLEGRTFTTRSLSLRGLAPSAAKDILQAKGFSGSEKKLIELIELYQGNPLKLNLVAARIKEVFGGSIEEFLQQGTLDFDNIYQLLDAQFQRLSDLEKDIMYCLALEGKPVPISELRHKIGKSGITDALASLNRRSLIEKNNRESCFNLQRLVSIYVTKQATR